MGGEINSINQRLVSFKRKYYLNLFIRGGLLTICFILFYFLLATLIEYNLWLGKSARFFIFTAFFATLAFCIFLFLKKPLSWWIYHKGLASDETAKMIGQYFPQIGDRLLNVIQLSSSGQTTQLLEAGIRQKSGVFEHIQFNKAIKLAENKKYLKFLLIPFAVIFSILLFNQSIITQSTKRLVKFNEDFSPEAPFSFIIQNPDLNAYLNEDFTLKLATTGEAHPTAVYILAGNQRWKMESIDKGLFSYTFEKIQNEAEFQFEGSGFISKPYKIKILNRPELSQVKILLSYPRYLNKKAEELTNAGNLEIPEGTLVTWKIGASNTKSASIQFASDGKENRMQISDNQLFNFSRVIKHPDQYSVALTNEYSRNKHKISYAIDVVKDQYPQINLEHLQDSVLYKNVYFGGVLMDDYGITELRVFYQIHKDNHISDFKNIIIPLTSFRNQQSFFYQWSIDSLKLEPGDKISYYLQVWDNDGTNGRKFTRSGDYVFSLPGLEELKQQVEAAQHGTESKIDESLKKAKELKKSIDEAQDKLKGKQSLDWQDKKVLDNLIDQKKKLDELIREIQKDNATLEQKKESFSEENQRIREKSEQIQKLMDELLDEETKKLFQELEKMLKENSDMNQIQKMLDKMDRKEINLEKELERALEQFKQLQYDFKLSQAINDVKSQKEEQEKLLEKSKELTGEKQSENKEKRDADELALEQQNLKKKLDQFEKQLKSLEKLGKDLDKDQRLPDDQQMQELKDSEQKSEQSLREGKPKKSIEEQKKSISRMKEMQDQLEGMSGDMEMEMNMANIESLRQIIHGLIKLSFDQESIMKDFNPIQQTDPKYVQLSQNQIKIKDDSKVLEDSLLELSKNDPFMGSFVIKEIGELNDHLDKAVSNIKERRKGSASSEMQYSMTSINNLSLMLKDHFDMMMNMMANAKPMKGKGKNGKPNMSQLQQQLNHEMEQIKNGGKKSGRELSEELAKMAAEQERIRRALQEMQEKMKQEGGKMPGNDLPGKMEQTEMDLVNKQITEQTIRRQKEILTRLLEVEKSMREQNQDNERKGESAKDYKKELPKAFEEYLRLKEKEVELLKTMPPKLYPYYKKEVHEYFKRIGLQD